MASGGFSRSPLPPPSLLWLLPLVPVFAHCFSQEALCIAYFTKVSSDEEACSELAGLGLSRYLIRVLPERRHSLQNRYKQAFG